ncbi:hypothetical protein FB451DRAFT_1188832 [Mycena latifolia]|nr:hypothetical protein FB451DRAFT_1188832 [Mycena latifolia]
MPEGWDTINYDEMNEDQRYKYFLLLAQDANFKLINRNVSTEACDPIIDDRTGYFCHRGEYSEHIRKHVDEEESSSCSGFQAMFLANAKRVKGLRVMGVGGVTCAHHNMWRPNGLGDLQAGERYCNMDFLFFSAVLNFALMYLVLSYDIVCQFSKNIWGQMPELPEKYHLNIDPTFVQWMIPNFHAPGHKKGCHSPFSFHWLWGAGRTHRETVEQNWEFLNGAAALTKLMGLGAQFAALEGLFAFCNWRRLVAHHTCLVDHILKCRMAEAIKLHQDAFDAFHAGLSERKPELVEEWRVRVEKYVKEQHAENEKDSPYEYVESSTTLKDVRLKLAQEEYARTGDGTEVEQEDTPSTFISMGMEIEESQRQLAVSIKAAGPSPSTSQQLDVLKGRTQLRVCLDAFRRLQLTYMPKLRRYMTPSQRAVWDADDKEPEATRLFMPSDLGTGTAREKACTKGLDGVEAQMRDAEAREALDQLRQGLQTRTATTKFKVRNWSGQRALTRGQGILQQINIKIHAAKLRYRYTRQALVKLKGHGDWEKHLKMLSDDDVRALNERSLTEEEKVEREQLEAVGEVPEEGGISAMGNVISGETHRTLSWIWYAVPEKDDDDEKLHEVLRVEWCKAYSRSRRWREELVTVEEEMRRTIAFGDWAEELWGAKVYALEQADRECRTSEKLQADWAAIRVRGAQYLRGEDIAGRPAIIIPVDSNALRWAEVTVYEPEEVENDMYQ